MRHFDALNCYCTFEIFIGADMSFGTFNVPPYIKTWIQTQLPLFATIAFAMLVLKSLDH